VSLQERLNRYRCALRMAQDRPLWGFGPGTFQFVYHPYQRREEMTRISAERDIGKRSLDTYGRGGGAHSEYFAALAEMGLPGLLLFLLFWVLALRVLLSRVTWPALAVCSLLLHFVLNNFLHDVRIATLFWMALAFGALKKNEPPPLRWPIR
jgi:putative inorganic carbon (hco3(-)) transporter